MRIISQRGFLLYVGIAAAIAIGGLTLALYVQSSRLEGEQEAHGRTKASYAAFVSDTKRMGLEAQKRADDQKAKDKLAKEKADAENAKTIAALTADIGRMRRERANSRGDGVPPAPPGSKRADLACFDRAEYRRAYGELVTEIRGGADEGTASTVNLNTARKWAQETP